MLARSCFHAGAPPRSDHVRAETYYSGYVFKDLPRAEVPEGAPAPPPRCLIVGLAQQSYGGNLPQKLVAKVNSKVLANWVIKFREAMYKKFPRSVVLNPVAAAPPPPPPAASE
eukprot:TRINITY_DN7075_c0_g2_i7.p2 TRINITY_DN7075_c0_g2~~TRINITY_DN7075_c0_g2_i7.p2  ORF type:complete len:113 (+),score=35.84 TRINITY_DN7075_c0_g2_i7:435-773(+)